MEMALFPGSGDREHYLVFGNPNITTISAFTGEILECKIREKWSLLYNLHHPPLCFLRSVSSFSKNPGL